MAHPLYATCPQCGEEYNLNYSEEMDSWDCSGGCAFDDCPKCGYTLTDDELTPLVLAWRIACTEPIID